MTIAQLSGELSVSGAGVQLRYPEPQDAPALFALARDPEVTRFFSWGPYTQESQALDWLQTLPARREAGVALELAVIEERKGLVGITLLSEFSDRDRRCVVGTWLGREHWGTGTNLKVKALVAMLAFEALGIERLGAYVDVRNGRSQKALERLGFMREGVLRSFHRHDHAARDVAIHALLREDWLRSPLAGFEAEISGRLPAAFVMAAP